MTTTLVEIGFIREAHGLRGQVVVHAFSGDGASLTQYGPLQNDDASRLYVFKVINAKDSDFLCNLDGVTDRDAAEKLRGTKLYVTADKLPPPDKDEFYIRDLLDLTVQNESGIVLGTVKDVLLLGNNSAFDIEFTHNGEQPLPAPQRELLLYTKENVLNVNVKSKILIISLPYGLISPLPSGEGQGEGQSHEEI